MIIKSNAIIVLHLRVYVLSEVTDYFGLWPQVLVTRGKKLPTSNAVDSVNGGRVSVNNTRLKLEYKTQNEDCTRIFSCCLLSLIHWLPHNLWYLLFLSGHLSQNWTGSLLLNSLHALLIGAVEYTGYASAEG